MRKAEKWFYQTQNSLVVGNNIIKPRTFTYNTGKIKRDEKYG